MHLFGKKIPFSVSLLLWCLVWELLGRAGVSSIFPPLSKIFIAATTVLSSDKFAEAVRISLRTFVKGMSLALIVGIGIGALMARVKTVRETLRTWVNVFVSAPISALVPILMGVLGIGEATVVATVFLFSVFVIILDTEVGICKADRSLVEMGRFLRREPISDFHKDPYPERFTGDTGRDPSGGDSRGKGGRDRPTPGIDHRRGRIVRAVFEVFSDGGILVPRHRRFRVRVYPIRSDCLFRAPG